MQHQLPCQKNRQDKGHTHMWSHAYVMSLTERSEIGLLKAHDFRLEACDKYNLTPICLMQKCTKAAHADIKIPLSAERHSKIDECAQAMKQLYPSEEFTGKSDV